MTHTAHTAPSALYADDPVAPVAPRWTESVVLLDDGAEIWRGTVSDFIAANELSDEEQTVILDDLYGPACRAHIGGGAAGAFTLALVW